MHAHDPQREAGPGAIAALFLFTGLAALLTLLFWLSTTA